MKRNTFFYLAIVLALWTSCGDDNNIDPIPMKPVFPDMSNVKINEVYRNGLLYLRFTYNEDNLPDSMIYTTVYEPIGDVYIRIKLEYDDNSRLISFRRLPGDCCDELNYEVDYLDDNLVEIKEFRAGQEGHRKRSYQFDQDRLESITGHSYWEGMEHFWFKTAYSYQNGIIYQISYNREYGGTYKAQFDDKLNPFYGIPSFLIGDVFPGLEYVPHNLLSLERENGTNYIFNEFTYNEGGYPTSVHVTTDNLDMEITYVE